MTAEIVACIDMSAYADSVCDYAAWFAGRMDRGISIVQASGISDPANAGLAAAAVERLESYGVDAVYPRDLDGDFVEAATALRPELIVMGKRGADSEVDRSRAGANVGRMLRSSAGPVCFTSKVFLPIGRGLVLLDADINHRTAVEFVSGYEGLRSLDMDLVVVARAGEDPDPKLAWARSVLASRDAQVFALRAEGLDAAIELYLQRRGADLIVTSRAVLAAAEDELADVRDRLFWRWRTPVLVC